MNGRTVAAEVLRKDLLLDLRSRDRLGHMAVFALLVVALLSIVLPASKPERLRLDPRPALGRDLVHVAARSGALVPGRGRGGRARAPGSGARRPRLGVPGQGGREPDRAGRGRALGRSAVHRLPGRRLEQAARSPAPPRACSARSGWPRSARSSLRSRSACASASSCCRCCCSRWSYPSWCWRRGSLPRRSPGARFPALWWAAFSLYDWVFALIGYFVFDFVLED